MIAVKTCETGFQNQIQASGISVLDGHVPQSNSYDVRPIGSVG